MPSFPHRIVSQTPLPGANPARSVAPNELGARAWLVTFALLGCGVAACGSSEESALPERTAAPANTGADPGQAQGETAEMPESVASVPPTSVPPPGAGTEQDPDSIVVDRPSDQQELEMLMPEPPMEEPEVTTMVTEQCANTAVTAVDKTSVQPADIIFAIDTSTSMGEETAFVQTYMNAFSQQIIDSGIDVRVILIGNYQPVTVQADPVTPPATDVGDDGATDPAAGQPVQQQPAAGGGGGFGGGGGGGGFGMPLGLCIDAPLGSGTCPQDENLPIYAHVGSSVGSNDVLNVLIDTYPQWQQHLRPEASKSIVIVSDDDATDAPNNSAAAFTTNLQALDPVMWASWTFSGIFCGMACPPASAAIGLVFQDLIAQTSGVTGELCLQDFQPVFDRLAEQIITDAGSEIACEWELPTAPEGQTFSVDLVEVSRTTAVAGTIPFTRVASLDACGPSSWYFDDPLNPTKVLACPETCEAMQLEDGGSIDVSFGCELIAGCADTSSTNVSAMAGDLSCSFPLPEPPEGVILDVATVNVRYETPFGFGVVLGTVASEAECANVDGGWYYDNPEEPTTINLCPATCTAYEAGTLTNVQALFGCAQKPADPLTGPR